MLWEAYNALALSIMNGTLDVPYEAIGRESYYYNDKVYFYYGYFPVLLRFILAPFVDLNTVNLARISVWLMTTIGAASLQYALIFYSRPKNSTLPWDLISKIKLILMSFIIWFGSAHFLIVQKGVLVHEPYAAMLMLSSLFLVLVYRDVFWDFKSRQYQLVLYALLAALCVHTRQTVALSLYSGVIILIVLKTIDTIRANKINDQKNFIKIFFYEFINNAYKPLLILFLGGALLLVLNYLRFDDLFAMTKGEYGFNRFGEEVSPRACGSYITGAGRFEVGRIIPNLFYYAIGGNNIHARFIDYLGLGYVRIAFHDIRFIFLWSSLLIAFLFVSWKLIRNLIYARSIEVIVTFCFLVALTISLLLILSYTTITVRYMADLWLPIGFTFLIFSKKWLFENKSHTNYLWYLMLISIIVNIAYSTHVYTDYKRWHLKSGSPGKEVVEKLYNPPAKMSKEDKDKACKKYNFRVRK